MASFETHAHVHVHVHACINAKHTSTLYAYFCHVFFWSFRTESGQSGIAHASLTRLAGRGGEGERERERGEGERERERERERGRRS